MKISTKNLVLAALLTAMSILIPVIFPTLPLGPFTATFASHLPIMIAMFVNPLLAVVAAVGSVIGFFIKMPGMPWVAARAAMHIPFALLGAYMLKKHYNTYLTGFVTMIVHAVLEVIIVLPFIGMMPVGDKTMTLFGVTISVGWAMVILIGTAIHHVIDFTLAAIIVPFLRKARVIDAKKVQA